MSIRQIFTKSRLLANGQILVKRLPKMEFLYKAPKMEREYCLRKFKDGGDHATLNDLPLPEGDWQEAYNKKNSTYNMILASGIVAFIISCYLYTITDSVELNYHVPEYPYEETVPKGK